MLARDSWDAWKAYTPTFAAGTGMIGNGSLSGMWRRYGDSLWYLVELVVGSTTTFESGQGLALTLPRGFLRSAGKILASSSRVFSGAYFLDSSAHANSCAGLSLVGDVANTIQGLAENSTGNAVTDTTPFTWANGDRLIMWGSCPTEPEPWAPAYALAFGGVDEYLSIGNVAAAQKERTDSFSIYARVKTTGTSFQVIAGKTAANAAGSSDLRGYDFYFWGDDANAGKLAFNLNNDFGLGGNYLSVRTNNAFNDGNWHDVLVTYNGTSGPSGVVFYVDGARQPTTTVNNTLSATIANSAPLTIGIQSTALGAPFIGNMSIVALYNAVVGLADARILTLAGPHPDLLALGPTANLVGLWRMGDGATFPTIPDDSVNNNVATMINMESTDIIVI